MIEIIISIVLLVILSVACYKSLKNGPKFKYHPRNPFIRECKECGAVHNNFQMAGHPDWWQQVHPGNKEDCKCKNHQTNPIPGW